MNRCNDLETSEPKPGSAEVSSETGWLRLVREQVGSLRFGVVQIVVHEARVASVERTEKVRFDKPSSEIV